MARRPLCDHVICRISFTQLLTNPDDFCMISLRCLHIIIGVVFKVWMVFRCLGILQTPEVLKKVAIDNVDVGDGYHLHLTVASRDPADLTLHVIIDFHGDSTDYRPNPF